MNAERRHDDRVRELPSGSSLPQISSLSQAHSRLASISFSANFSLNDLDLSGYELLPDQTSAHPWTLVCRESPG